MGTNSVNQISGKEMDTFVIKKRARRKFQGYGLTYNSILSLLLMMACTSPPSKREAEVVTAESVIKDSYTAMGGLQKLDTIETISAVANCQSPKGSYRTEIQSTFAGYLFFRQEYDFKPQAYTAVLVNERKGFSLPDTLELSAQEVMAIRCHSFHQMLVNLHVFFHDIDSVTIDVSTEEPLYVLKAKDILDHSASIYFSKDTRLCAGFDVRNPDNKDEIIRIRLSKWEKIQSVIMPLQVDLDESGKHFIFQFTKLQFNSPDFHEWKMNH